MGRGKGALVVDLDAAAEMLLTTTAFLKREIKEGGLRAVRLGNKTVLRVDELRDYLLRKEAEEPVTRKVKKSKKTSADGIACRFEECAIEESSVPLEAEPAQEERAPELKDDDAAGLDAIWGDASAVKGQE